MKIKFSFISILFTLTFQFNILYSQLIINEIFITNASADLDKSDFNFNNWIEIYNNSETTINSNKFYLSDEESFPQKWKMLAQTLAPNKYLIVFPDGNNRSWHTNFKLDPSGGTLYLSDSKGKIIDKITYPRQYLNASYGRISRSSGKWGFYSTPTRLSENKGNVQNDQAGPVIFKTRGGFYNKSINLELISAHGTGSIYYTLDGSEPTLLSSKYSQTISITKTSVVRARVFADNRIPGEICTNTYFINERKPKMKIVSLVTPPKFLTDDSIGIYVTGKNGTYGNCADRPQNYNRDWERTANFEFFENDYQQKVNQLVGIKISGACSRGNAQKSLIITTKEKYGRSRLNYKFFNHRDFENFNSLLLRNSGNDWCVTMFRDAMNTQLTEGRLGLEYMAYEPAVIYINGKYFGIQNIRERSNEELIESIKGIDPENIDLCENGGTALLGSADEYNKLITYIRSHNLADSAAYKYVESQIDIDNFINYYIAQIYCGNNDWPGNNIKFWRQRNPVTKWRWILYDTDFTFGFYSDVTFNTLKLALTINNNWPNYEWSTILFRKIIENKEFKNKFLSRFYTHMGSTYEPTRIIGIIDSMANLISSEIPYHFQRWQRNEADWSINVENMREFARQRPAYVRQFLRDTFFVKEDVSVTYSANAGSISFDGTPSVGSHFNGTFPLDTKLQVNFIPNSGFRFVKATKKTDNSKDLKIIESGNTWRYFDSGAVNNINWQKTSFDDSKWKKGKSQFGYGENDENTTLYFGPDGTKKYTTYYFRDTFQLTNVQQLGNYNLRILYDDGAVVYLNEKEAARIGMPTGTVTYETFGTGPTTENIFYDIPFDSSLLVNGINTIAVEVHQSNLTSSDVSFDLELSATRIGKSYNWETTRQSFTDTINGNTQYTAWFEPVVKYNNLIINELSTLNYTLKDEFNEADDWFEIYNAGTDTIDLAGLYFTDSLAQLTKYCITTTDKLKTVMPPKTYKVIWADGTPAQGPLHLGFKLNYKGEELAVSQKVGNSLYILDQIKYDECFGSKTFGRFPNASGNFKWLNTATPGAANKDNLLAVNYSEKSDSIGISILQKQHFLNIKSEQLNTTNTFYLTDIAGKRMVEKSFKNELNIDLSDYKSGIYFVTIFNENGQLNKKIVLQ